MDLGKLKYYINARLESLTDINIYDGSAPENATFPYLVYIIQSSTKEEHNKHRILEIDFWDDTNDDSAILAASKVVEEGKYVGGVLTVYGLDKSYQVETEGYYRCYIDMDGEIPVIESNMSRIYQRYLLIVN